MLGRGVGSIQAGALAPQVPSVYARSYIRLDPISHRAWKSRNPHIGKIFHERSTSPFGVKLLLCLIEIPEFDRKQFKLAWI